MAHKHDGVLQPTVCMWICPAAGRGVEDQPTHRDHCRAATNNAQQKGSSAAASQQREVESNCLVDFTVCNLQTRISGGATVAHTGRMKYFIGLPTASQLQSLLLALLNTTWKTTYIL